MPFDDPLGRIEDMLEAVTRIQEYTAGFTRETFEAHQKTIDAAMRNFTILGEAANHVSAEITARYPQVPWNQMRGLRNVAVHEYARVNVHVIWQAITLHLPPLAGQRREILEREQ